MKITIENQRENFDAIGTLKDYLNQKISYSPEILDMDPEALRLVMKELGELKLLALTASSPWSTKKVSPESFFNFQEELARYSGALVFLQLQHQSAAKIIAQGDNQCLQKDYLCQMEEGKLLVGVAISQLRRNGEKTLNAVPVNGGYRISGQVPWITGFKIFQKFVAGAKMPDGRVVLGLVTFVNHEPDSHGGSFSISHPLKLVAMSSTNSVNASFDNWFLPNSSVITIKPKEWFQERDEKNLLNVSPVILGCTKASLDIIESQAKNKNNSFIYDSLESLSQEFIQCRTSILKAKHELDSSYQEHLNLRTWAIELMMKCTRAAMIASGGQGCQISHDAQRVCREALIYTVSGQTVAILESSLKRLS